MTSRQIAEWRRKSGVWYGDYVVIGYDETFTMAMNGKVDEGFAQEYLRYKLCRQLGVSIDDVIFKSIRKEGG